MTEQPTTIRAARAAQAERSMSVLNTRMDGQHLPRRPQWECGACEREWPCDPARVRLAEAYGDNRINLAIYVGSLLHVATAELPDADTADLYERFIAWTR